MKKHFSLALIMLFGFTTKANVTLPALISDNMVIQQNSPVHIWGKALPGEKVTITISNQNLITTPDSKGKWQTWLMPMKAAGPVTMTVRGLNTIIVKNILIGEVWVASGQSNMEWNVGRALNPEEEIKKSGYPNIRLFEVKKGISDTIKTEVEGKWEICSPQNIAEFSAVAYFFGRGLHKNLNVPVGLIESDWSATACQPWTPMSTLETDSRLKYILDDWQKVADRFPERKKTYEAELERWKTESEQQKAQGKTSAPAPREPNILPKEKPGVLYNAMIAPLTAYTIRGVIWYQGEANAYERVSFPYRYLFPAMIQSWRDAWKQGDFPFLFVQLSTLYKHPYWPVLRESQTETLKLKNTGMAVSIDVGDSTDAHYHNKQAVGHRLELIARNLVYNQAIEFYGPVFRQITIENNKIRVWFDHAKGLKSSDGKGLTGFVIAGKDGKPYSAEAKIEGQTVLLYSPNVDRPQIAKYAFKDAPVVNLVNGANLPAVPFRTDIKNGL
ncbi:sialate O-acetylesterase [Pedobacter sp. P351]|uniref:sialate O-acetylesterase n=1 Tax=Pedobacter superstes TaxID=3133441 RepID=UPI0030AC6DF9